MVTWITGDNRSKNQMVYEKSSETLVVYGRLESDSDITFKVRNFVLFGEIISKNSLTIIAEENICLIGKVSAKNRCIVGREGIRFGSERTLEIIRSLGIVISRTNSGIEVQLPELTQSL